MSWLIIRSWILGRVRLLLWLQKRVRSGYRLLLRVLLLLEGYGGGLLLMWLWLLLQKRVVHG
jgi:hypothetical protein